jgi:hypothetical protein
MRWEVEYTYQFEDWYEALEDKMQDGIISAVEHLELYGPGLGRPLVDTVKGSRHSHLKELRPLVGSVRILFAFDPRRMAILLLGGDKTNQRDTWYDKMIPIADQLYDEHLEELKREGLLP